MCKFQCSRNFYHKRLEIHIREKYVMSSILDYESLVYNASTLILLVINTPTRLYYGDCDVKGVATKFAPYLYTRDNTANSKV